MRTTSRTLNGTQIIEVEAAAPSPAEIQRMIRRLRRIAVFLDDSIQIPILRKKIGADAILGLVPGIGDLIGAGLAGYIVVAAVKMGTPTPTIARMLVNLLIDTLVGMVPVAGDVFDAAWKANMMNVDLLEEAFGLREPPRRRRNVRAIND